MKIKARLVLLSLLSVLAVSTNAQSGGGITIDKGMTAPGNATQGNNILIQSVFGESLIGATSGVGISISGGFLVPNFAPTAAGVSISGTVLAPNGTIGVQNAYVTLTDASGSSRTTKTTAFGRFRFEGVAAGQTYILSVSSRRYLYLDQLVRVDDGISNLQFVGQRRT